jgi:hypothetical protein
VILGAADLSLVLRAAAPPIGSNFGTLSGAWLELAMPEISLTNFVLGYGSDPVRQAAQSDCPDFAGLVGLPLLRLVEYGGDSTSFWLRPAATVATP